MSPARRRSAASRRSGDSRVVERTRRSSQRRLVRTVVLGAVAVAVAIWWMAVEWGMDPEELLGYVLASLALVGIIVLLALAAAALLRLIRKLTGR